MTTRRSLRRVWSIVLFAGVGVHTPLAADEADPSRALLSGPLKSEQTAVDDGYWINVSPSGSAPSARDGHTVIYDPVRKRLLVFGGSDGGLPIDVWALSLAGTPAWTALAPTGTPPPGRYKATAVYDPVRDRMLVFGGDEGMTLSNGVWALSLAGTPAWTALTPTGTPPSLRYKHAAIYDPVRDRMLVFGGFDASGLRNDVWALSLAGTPAWAALAPTGSPPSARFLHTAIYDPVRDCMVVFGGIDGTLRDDTWALSLAGSPAWAALAPAGTPPSPRYEHTAIYDPTRDRMVVFGGYDSGYRNDASALSLAGGGTWNALAPGATPPSARISPEAVYDPVRDRMLVFGGTDVNGRRNDVWALAWNPAVSVNDGVALRGFALAAPRPNPSRDDVVVEFELQGPARVVLDVFDMQGRRVNRIADEWFAAGRHAGTWRGDDEGGHALGNGLYFIRMRTSGFQATRRVMRVR